MTSVATENDEITSKGVRRDDHEPALPVNLMLNHGTYCSKRCLDVLRRHDGNTALRMYPSAGNEELRCAIAAEAGVSPENVLMANGSGPLLKTSIPFLIEQKIRQSFTRMGRYLLKRPAYPIITTRLTYSKVPAAAIRLGLRCDLLPLSEENGFTLDLDALAAQLRRRDGLVYLCNPNNPTGNVLATREQIEPLLGAFPETWFFVDEAYIHYLPNWAGHSMTDLVRSYPNLAVLRSFSFAYGLASLRVGYLIANPKVVAQLETKLTPHRVGELASELAIASLEDRRHVGFVQEETASQRQRLMGALKGCDGLKPHPSLTNFILCSTSGPWTGQIVHDALLARGVKVKIFEPFGAERYDRYFRLTIGLPSENAYFIEQLDRVMRLR